MGCRMAIANTFGLSDGMTCPVICVVSAAASRSIPAARCTLKPAQGAVAPVSSSITLAKSAALFAIRSAALSSRARRAFGPISDQARKPFAADPTAFSTSATLAAAADGRNRPGHGIAPLEPGGRRDGLPVDEKIDIHFVSLAGRRPPRSVCLNRSRVASDRRVAFISGSGRPEGRFVLPARRFLLPACWHMTAPARAATPPGEDGSP